MKNLYKKGKKVHPSPPPQSTINDHLISLLPSTILTLTLTLSPQDKQVLAYLISCCESTTTTINLPSHQKTTHKSGDDGSGGGEHEPTFGCSCFRCYKSFWARWDTSPNRQVIHEIIEAYEEVLFERKKKSMKKKKERGKRVNDECLKEEREVSLKADDSLVELDLVEQPSCGGGNGDVEVEVEKGSNNNNNNNNTVRKIVGFIGEKIWGAWI